MQGSDEEDCKIELVDEPKCRVAAPVSRECGILTKKIWVKARFANVASYYALQASKDTWPAADLGLGFVEGL